MAVKSISAITQRVGGSTHVTHSPSDAFSVVRSVECVSQPNLPVRVITQSICVYTDSRIFQLVYDG